MPLPMVVKSRALQLAGEKSTTDTAPTVPWAIIRPQRSSLLVFLSPLLHQKELNQTSLSDAGTDDVRLLPEPLDGLA
jgi:hypothetical protein